MNWFKRHLNWTWVLSFLLYIAVGLMMEEIGAGWLLWLVFAFTIGPITIWVLKKKGRSPWWITLLVLGSPLWLGKKWMSEIEIAKKEKIAKEKEEGVL